MTPELINAIKIASVARCMGYGETQDALALIPEGARAGIELRLQIKGVVTRGYGYEVSPTNVLLSKAVLSKLVRRLGAQREAFKVALAQAAIDAIASDQTTGQVLLEEDRKLLLTIDEVEREVIAKLPKTRRVGSVKVAAEVKFTRTKIEPHERNDKPQEAK